MDSKTITIEAGRDAGKTFEMCIRDRLWLVRSRAAAWSI